MKRQLHRAVDDWLRQEGEGRGEQAERSLTGVFAHLPVESIPVGFGERVLARAGLVPSGIPTQPWAAVWTFRAALSLSMILGALFLVFLPSCLPSLLGIVHPGRVAEIGVTALIGVLERLGVGLVIWRALTSVGAILSSALSSPPFMTALALGILLSIGAFRFLSDLVVSERSSHYVSSV